MLDSTLELINLVSSNSHLMFCFCNLIIGILFVTNSKTVQRHRYRSDGLATVVDDKKQADDVVLTSTIEKSMSVKKAPITVVTEVVIPDVARVIIKEDDEDHINDEQNEDELRRRAEEFIEKVNRSWRAERSGSFPQRGHREQVHGHLGRSRTMVM
ncbi:hypothetical protein ACHQM5_001140 [Ranunculus cassubicifolius]